MLVVKLAARISLSQPYMPWRREGRGSMLLDGAMTTMHKAMNNKQRTAIQLLCGMFLALLAAQEEERQRINLIVV